MKTKHKHSFDKAKIVNIHADNPRYSIADSGAWSFITRECECGLSEAVDMIRRADAKTRLEQLI